MPAPFELDELEMGGRVAEMLEVENLKPLMIVRPDLPGIFLDVYEWYKRTYLGAN